MTPRATGRPSRREGRPAVVFERTFRAPIDDVWAAVTESSRLERWIGTWAGDPSSGSVQFQVKAEGYDPAETTYEIVRCEAPRLLEVRTVDDFAVWHLVLELREEGPTTRLTFTQVVEDPKIVESVGPGWDYYLDRLVAAESGGDVAAIDFGDYDPPLRGHYLEVMTALEGS